MSAASEEARGLLADEREAEQEGGMTFGAFRLGGIVDRLAGEVEAAEQDTLDLANSVDRLVAENGRLGAALKAASRLFYDHAAKGCRYSSCRLCEGLWDALRACQCDDIISAADAAEAALKALEGGTK